MEIKDDTKVFIQSLTYGLDNVLSILATLGLPYMELQNTLKDIKEDNYTIYLQDIMGVEGNEENIKKISLLLDKIKEK